MPNPNLSTNFTKYTIAEARLIALTKVCVNEQGNTGELGIAKEASLMANKFELAGGYKGHIDGNSIYDYVRNVGWWAHAKSVMDNNPRPSDDNINTVRNVFVYGWRTLPPYVNEHDMFAYKTSSGNYNNGDIDAVDFNADGSWITDAETIYSNRHRFISGTTKIRNKYMSENEFFVFVCWANSDPSEIQPGMTWSDGAGDPFGYTPYAYRKVQGYGPQITNSLNALVDIALREASLGVKEDPPNSNTVKYNTWYYGREVSGPDYPWCMAFVQWCLNEAGIQAARTASCTQFMNAYKNTYDTSEETGGCWVARTQLQPGDIILFSKTSTTASTVDHVGIVVEVKDSNTYITVEGNTSGSGSQDSGGAVLKKTRYLDQPTLGTGGGIVRGVRLQQVSAYGGSSYYQEALTVADWEAIHALDDYAKNLESAKNQYYTGGSAVSESSVKYEEFTYNKKQDVIISTDTVISGDRLKGTSLLTTPSFVESPFISLKVGNYVFGVSSQMTVNKNVNLNQYYYKSIVFPNFVQNIDVVKLNGQVNQYTISLVYQIQAGQDPNMVDKIFSSVGYGTVYISYGDFSEPAFIYREEEAIITSLTSDVDFVNSRINYVLKCTSNSLSLMGGSFDFGVSSRAKPSQIIRNTLFNWSSTSDPYGMKAMFPGMKSQTLVNSKGLIPTDDSFVYLEAKHGIDPLSYLNYLVSCMCSAEDVGKPIRSSNYYLTIHDDITGEFGGSYFKIHKVSANGVSGLSTENTYEVDIGYPGDTLVTGFKILTNNSWALLYNYSEKVLPEVYTYDIDDSGDIVQTSAPNILVSSTYNRVTESQRNWWTQMTQFPIKAELTIKGLLRPALLMTYIRINVLFYGQRHASSGLYVITKQRDTVSSQGYRTILSLTRVAGDTDTIATTVTPVTVKVPIISDVNNQQESGTTVNDNGF